MYVYDEKLFNVDNILIYILKLLTCTCGTVIICCGLRLSKLCLWAKTLATSCPSFSRSCSECRSLLLRGPNDPRCCGSNGTVRHLALFLNSEYKDIQRLTHANYVFFFSFFNMNYSTCGCKNHKHNKEAIRISSVHRFPKRKS